MGYNNYDQMNYYNNGQYDGNNNQGTQKIIEMKKNSQLKSIYKKLK